MLGSMAERRLPVAWQVTSQSVYGALERLEADGLVVSAHSVGSRRGDRAKRIYSATERTEAAVAAWMEGPVSREPVRVELQARIAMSSSHHAPLLLRALDAYERDCFAMLKRSSEAEVPMGSWAGLVMNLTRQAVDGGIQAELTWITQARIWIEDFLAEQATSHER
jgi:DNA-binding PadR family transcriptional regulator